MYNENPILNKLLKLDIDCLYEKKDVAVCLLNILHFKFYNLVFGYECGNKMLDLILNEVQKSVDGLGNAYWLSNSKFLILLRNLHSRDDVIEVVKRIKIRFDNFTDFEGHNIRVLFKVGISLFPSDSQDIKDIFKYAETALYYTDSVKICSFFQPEMHKRIAEKYKINFDILNPNSNSEFLVYYQPQIDIRTNKVYGMEALLRWKHPTYGIISPVYFIEALEQSGMINEIDKFVFRQSCAEIGRLLKLGFNNLNVSINISPSQFQNDSFIEFVKSVFEETNVNPKYISLEITERMLVDPTNNLINVLKKLRNIGIKIFIDDFGVGYSSMSYLCNLPIDGIKIDKSFIDKIQYSQRGLVITKNIVKLARDLNLEVVAEGVENKQQLNHLKDINCYKVQGFIFSKPLMPKELTDYISSINILGGIKE